MTSEKAPKKYHIGVFKTKDTWDDVYPGSIPNKEYHGVFKTNEAQPCFMCGTNTCWYDVNYQGPLCGPQCQIRAGDEAAAAPQKSSTTSDVINHPAHYTQGIECIDYIASHNFPYCEGNIIKYITRWRHKDGVTDLKKARFYLDYLINQRDEGGDGSPKRIYIAGPYTSENKHQRDQNIELAARVCALLIHAGHFPFCPHTHTARFEDEFLDIHPEMYSNLDMQFQRVCHRLFVLPNWETSEGTKKEIEQAANWMQPCDYRLSEVPNVTGYPTIVSLAIDFKYDLSSLV